MSKSRTSLKRRELLSPVKAGGLAAVFKVLASDTRLRLLHAILRTDEICLTDLARTVGMKPPAVSNQIQRLQDLGIVQSRRDGNNVFYRVVDLCVSDLLDRACCLMDESEGRSGLIDRANSCCEPCE
jgi:DNA-binding transcriptional ArsR family regulator